MVCPGQRAFRAPRRPCRGILSAIAAMMTGTVRVVSHSILLALSFSLMARPWPDASLVALAAQADRVGQRYELSTDLKHLHSKGKELRTGAIQKRES